MQRVKITESKSVSTVQSGERFFRVLAEESRGRKEFIVYEIEKKSGAIIGKRKTYECWRRINIGNVVGRYIDDVK